MSSPPVVAVQPPRLLDFLIVIGTPGPLQIAPSLTSQGSLARLYRYWNKSSAGHGLSIKRWGKST
jgi:hypothetical protein